MSDVAAIVNIIGVFLFAMSGASSARIAGFDLFGAAIVALVTATGGGVFRDLALNETPKAFETNLIALLALGAVALVALIRGAERATQTKLFELGDTLGVVAFSLVGAQTAMAADLAAAGVLGLAFANANLGGVVRDVICGQKPLVLTRKWNGTISVGIGAAVLICAELGVAADVAAVSISVAALAIGAALNLSGAALRRM